MIRLSALPSIVERTRKRKGRGYGSGIGAKSGRGTTRHQAAREKIKIEYEGGQNKMTKKFPLMRGKGKNKSLKSSVLSVRIGKLGNLPANTEVTLQTLLDTHLIKKNQQIVKIVAGGKLKSALILKLPISEKAAEVVVASGGKIIPQNS